MISTTAQVPAFSNTCRLGGWLPACQSAVDEFLKCTIKAAEAREGHLHPVIAEFQEMIEGDPVMNMYFTQMFEQQRRAAPTPGSGDIKLRDYRQMLAVLNYVIETAPEYDTTALVGFPINAILDYPMITPAGLSAFATEKVNRMFRKVLAAWARFLDSPDSLYVLNASPKGWLSPEAWAALRLDEFQLDASAPYLGFKSWNDFFIRRFKPGARPVAHPDDDDVLVSACESAPYAVQTDVRAEDRFWIKSQPYSLRHMLAENFVEQFVGGTVYQAFLSAKSYHRWHSPISGTIKKVELVPGTYYAEAASVGFDPAGPNNSQGYIAHTATRALIFIEADNAGIGLVGFVAVGMAEVSSCVVTAEEGEHVKKGDQIGYFQYGGSTHCLVFRKGALGQLALEAIPQDGYGAGSTIVKVNSVLATASRTPRAGVSPASL